jgi:nucleoside-diphosphate-sugar epimerase
MTTSLHKILITGASGFIGRHLVPALQSQGLSVVTGLAWQGSSIAQELVAADITAVIHLAGMAHGQVAAAGQQQLHQVNAVATERLFAACEQAEVETFIWLSSIKAIAERASEPLLVEHVPQPEDAYAHSKAAGEQLLAARVASRVAGGTNPTRLVVVRPPLVYGPGVAANFYQLIHWAGRGIPLPFAGAHALRSLVGVDNLVSFLHHALQAPTGTYHVSDGDDQSVAQLLRSCARLMQRPIRLFSVPDALLLTLGQLAGRRGQVERLLQPLRVDISQSCTRLSWQPPFSVEQQLEGTVQWYLKQA